MLVTFDCIRFLDGVNHAEVAEMEVLLICQESQTMPDAKIILNA